MADIDRLHAQVRGPVITADDDGYDQARRVYNGMHDRRPKVIVQAVDEADVIAGVRFARENGLELAVRGGGHSVPGYGTCNDGLVLDLGRIKYVRVDPDARTGRVGGGAVLGDLDHACHPFGLATPAGFNSTTGIGGLTLGGGFGPYLSRKHGLTCDNLISADVVTAEGKRVTASAQENDDLFWALRGGGGNFGVVTSFEFRLHPLGGVVGGPIFFELDAAPEVMRVFRDYTRQAPRELGGFFGFHIAPPLPFIPEDRHGETLCAIVASWCGAPEKADEMLRPLREAGPVVAEHVGPVPYPVLQSAFDPLLPPGLQHYWKSDFLADLTDEAIDAHMKHGPSVPYVQLGHAPLFVGRGGPRRRAGRDRLSCTRRSLHAQHHRHLAGAEGQREERRLGPRLLRGRPSAFGLRGGIHELHGRRRPGPRAGELRCKLRPLEGDQDALGPR